MVLEEEYEIACKANLGWYIATAVNGMVVAVCLALLTEGVRWAIGPMLLGAVTAAYSAYCYRHHMNIIRAYRDQKRQELIEQRAEEAARKLKRDGVP